MMVEYDLIIYGVGKIRVGFDKAGAFTIVNELERMGTIESSVIKKGPFIIIPLNIKKGGYGVIEKFEKGSILYDIPRNSLVILTEDFTPSEYNYAYVGKVLDSLDKLELVSRVTKAKLKPVSQEASG